MPVGVLQKKAFDERNFNPGNNEFISLARPKRHSDGIAKLKIDDGTIVKTLDPGWRRADVYGQSDPCVRSAQVQPARHIAGMGRAPDNITDKVVQLNSREFGQ